MDSLFNRNPQGWTDRGTKRGWIKPVPAPHNPRLGALEKENEQLKSVVSDLMERITRLEGGNGS